MSIKTRSTKGAFGGSKGERVWFFKAIDKLGKKIQKTTIVNAPKEKGSLGKKLFKRLTQGGKQ